MKPQALFCKIFVLLACLAVLQPLAAQQVKYILKPPVTNIHFGRGNVRDINSTEPYNYERISGSCPTDGHYTFCSSTPGCFRGDWFMLTEDHTPGDVNGNMMLVNANPGGGVFLNYSINSLRGNTTYEFSIWVINVCRLYVCCSDLSPRISVMLTTKSGKRIATLPISNLEQLTEARWKNYKVFFTVLGGENEVVLTMQDNAIGGCGNDFALDDITIRERVIIPPPVTVKPKAVPQPVTSKKPAPLKPVVKQPLKTPAKTVVTQQTKKDSTITITPLPEKKPALAIVPLIVRTRENPVVKQIQTAAGEIEIKLYDNGTIDGDTVSIYHNNELVVSRAKLSETPVTYRIKLDASNRHHELIMVANNLGSIPPNTSLMIITANNKRYEIFISSSEQKNAKVVIDLQE